MTISVVSIASEVKLNMESMYKSNGEVVATSNNLTEVN